MIISYTTFISKKSRLFRENILVKGIVQGVGFRPFVYNLASRLGLTGLVSNTTFGIEIFVQGTSNVLNEFFYCLKTYFPPLAFIYNIRRIPVAIQIGEKRFFITPSKAGIKRTLISPDIAVCDICILEMNDPSNRRYRYPFINCSNCGPRYTIIKNLPYDRPQTTMASFTMCSICQIEYNDSTSRRFHTQPNGCPICGPRLWLADMFGAEIKSVDPLLAAAQALRDGYIIAIKGIGGFHLAVDATNDLAVARLRLRKQRKEKPLAIMVTNIEVAHSLVELIPLAEKKLLNNQQRPIILAPIKINTNLAPSINLRNDLLGLMLPYTPIHHLLMAEGFQALVMTSGNISNEPICIDNNEAISRIGGQSNRGIIADLFLLHNRDIYLRNDDSVIRVLGNKVRQVRRSRGFVPMPIILSKNMIPKACPPILATGGQLKNTLCLLRGYEAFLSQHIGELENIETLTFFEQIANHFQYILDSKANFIACDLHEDYISTQWAQSQGLPLVRVQHHHAHAVAVMAEAGLSDSSLALTLDGSGFGPNYTIWGGELLRVNLSSYERLGSLLPFRLLGGKAAIKEPWRIGLSLLIEIFGERFIDLDLPILRNKKNVLELFIQMINKKINSPLTSSLGRLFDGVAALAGICCKSTYEGQAAIELEQTLDPYEKGAYSFSFSNKEGLLVLDWRPAIIALVDDIGCGVKSNIISTRFHRGIIDTLAIWALKAAEITGLNQLCLGGGCFMNAKLLCGIPKRLAKSELIVHTPSLVPAGDGGLALGQVLAAAASWGEGLLKLSGETVLGPLPYQENISEIY